ncbi:cue domain containing protein [Grosmannia clavigera kw1407]|uniref:Cue domain containing protein n=1 Tax=Grosmannia clavigera (strain kw1407 / UAMH 11150) TaxID=655863 RepID=F0XTK5_GROCL|nr:cue domain containing protein [Grosmannia clavigera kw1407]EFW98660.1 cue domain containing protein [Grosmannia clavigera kw1407]
MSAPSDPKAPAPESPTTARPLEMDDDDITESNIVLSNNDESTSKPATADSNSPKPAVAAISSSVDNDTAEEPAPPKPPRPMTEQQKSEQTLKDAFPTVEMPVVRAVLTASRGNIEAAFHALLEMTDPAAIEQEAPPPPQPPRPAAYGRLSPNSQLAADEQYARRLAQHYESEGAYESRTSSYGPRSGSRRGDGPPYPPRPRPETGLNPNELWDDRDRNFLDDDLPVIRENLRKGFVETQAKFSTWFTGIKKRIDDEFNGPEDDDEEGHPGSAQGPRPQGRPGGPVGGGRGGYGNYPSRQRSQRSGDYDADPELLSDDFAGIKLHGDGTPVQANNPNAFRPPPPSTSPRPGSDRKVAFRGNDEVIDVYSASPRMSAKDGTSPTGAGSAKASKWQPLSAVDPAPIGDADPFSLGDSDDEKDVSHNIRGPAEVAEKTDKSATTTSDAVVRKASSSPEDAERLRKAAAEAMADSLVEDKPKA